MMIIDYYISKMDYYMETMEKFPINNRMNNDPMARQNSLALYEEERKYLEDPESALGSYSMYWVLILLRK